MAITKKLIYESLLGIEIEIEKAFNPLAIKLNKKRSRYWLLKEDGSLRHNGAELVLAYPLSTEKALEAIDEAYCQLIDKNMEASVRCATHVHLDIRNMQVPKIGNFCILYALFEEPLFAWVGAHRDSNNFCLPWYEAEGDVPLISQMLSAERQSNLSSIAKTLHRYSAMNLNAIHKFGSIEARHLLTPKDPNRLIDWINILLCLKKYAVEYEQDCSNILKDFENQGGEALGDKVFGEYSKQINTNLISLGVLLARDLLTGKETNLSGGFYGHLVEIGEPEGYSLFKNKKNKPKPEIHIPKADVFDEFMRVQADRLEDIRRLQDNNRIVAPFRIRH